MAISTNFTHVKEKFRPSQWESIDQFEHYYLQRISETLQDTNYYTDKYGQEKTIPPVSHFPDLKEYEVWMEGYAATGESGQAHLVGKTKARCFAEACHIVMCRQYLEYVEKANRPENTKYENPSRWDYDPSQLSSWGCRLFWSQELAMKSFG